MTLTTLPPSEGFGAIAYRACGAGMPLVLLHGVGLQSAAWGPQLAELGRNHRVIALDLPGHGGSDPLPPGSLLPAFVQWCAHALRVLEEGPVSLVGHSMGALIAGGVAVEHADAVERLALLNGGLSAKGCGAARCH